MAYVETLDQLVANTYLLATGKTTPLSQGTTKYTKITALANLFTRQWSREVGTDWRSLRTIVTFAATISATDTYALPTTISEVSSQDGDFVRVYHTDGVSESDYTLVPIERLYDDGPTLNNGGRMEHNATGTCAIYGGNLIFSRAFLSTDPQIGASIKMAGFSIPAALVNPSDLIVVDDPFWLEARCAAEYVRNDVTRVQLYQSLIEQANVAMEQMKEYNSTQDEYMYTGSWRPLGNTWDSGGFA